MSFLRGRALAWISLIVVFGGLSLVASTASAMGADRTAPAPIAGRGSGHDPANAALPGPGRSAPRALTFRSHGGRAGAAGLPRLTPGARPASAITQNPGYAGYQVSPASGSPLSVSFVVPTLTCPSNRYYGVIPGVLAGGTDYLGAGVALECYGGQAHYTAVSFYNGPFDNLGPVVSPGDSISVSVSVNATSSQATLSDVTTGDSGTNTYPGFSMSYADIGDDSEYNYYTPLGEPSFGSIAFNAATVGGANLGTLSPSGYSMGDGTTALIKTSAIGPDQASFTTTFERSLFPTTVQGRVIEGVAGQQTLAATVWPVTFTSTASSSASAFTATIYWGDGSSSAGSVSTVGAQNCTYSPLTPVGTCFAVTGQHTYSASGIYYVYVMVQGPTGAAAGATGIAEIVSPSSASVENSIGVLTWKGLGGKVEECTATALAGLDEVLTADHCFDDISIDNDFQFAPEFSGNCGSGNNQMTVSECLAKGDGHDKGLGYWTGTVALVASDNGNVTDAGQDTALVGLNDTSSKGYSLASTVVGLPIHFDPPHGQLKFSVYGYPGRVGNWNLQKCINEKDLSDSSDSVVGISPCDFGYSNGLAGGTSGGPFISSKILPNAISATQWFICPPSGGCDEGGQLVWPHPESSNSAIGNYMSNNSMQLYVVSIWGVPEP